MPLRHIRNPRSFEKCIMCAHGYISHTEFDSLTPSKCHNLVDKLRSYKPCNCKEFLPEDNLEFLEHEYAKRRLGDGCGKV